MRTKSINRAGDGGTCQYIKVKVGSKVSTGRSWSISERNIITNIHENIESKQQSVVGY